MTPDFTRSHFTVPWAQRPLGFWVIFGPQPPPAPVRKLGIVLEAPPADGTTAGAAAELPPGTVVVDVRDAGGEGEAKMKEGAVEAMERELATMKQELAETKAEQAAGAAPAAIDPTAPTAW